MTDKSVKKRHVFYLPGYDPMPARRYREIYRREGAAQARISGYNLNISAKPVKNGPYCWQVEADINGQHTSTTVEFLLWNDIVQSSMTASIPATYWLMLRTLWLYLRTGALFALIRLRPAPMIAALYPVAVLMGQLLLAILVGFLVGWLGRFVFVHMAIPFVREWEMQNIAYFGMVLVVVSAVIGIGTGVVILQKFKKHDGRIYAYYLLYDYAYSAWNAGAHTSEMRARIEEFKTRVAAALLDDNHEVLVVGHSSGAHLAIELLAEMERDGKIAKNEDRLSLLTLGQVVPMISYLPAAQGLRRNLHDLAQSKTITWVDFSAPGDGACFALCDPVACSGVAPTEQTGPKILSAAFSQSLSPEKFKAQKNQFFRQHFQYLCSFDQPGIYDYFAITAGPKMLKDRFEGKAHSPSKQTRCTSKHVGMADG